LEFGPLSNKVIGCAIEVHRHLGPGLLESSYQRCLAHELKINQIRFEAEKQIPLEYKGITLDCSYRIDILVENSLLLELKSVDEIAGIHRAQILTYMKLSNTKLGLLINFNVNLLKNGLQRFVL